MKANELRIGNIIESGRIELLELRENRIVCIRCDNGRIVSNPSPEEITEEWLLKFRLQKTEHEDHQLFGNWTLPNIEGWPISLEEDITLDYMFSVQVNNEYEIAKIKYVHQLQNLYFVLTGEELPLLNGVDIGLS
jgi:hypothetical protein